MAKNNGTAPKKRRAYSDKEVAEALAVLDLWEGDTHGAARELKIPESTLRQWAEGRSDGPLRRMETGDFAQLRQEKKESLADAFEDVAWRCVNRLRVAGQYESETDLLKSEKLQAVAVATTAAIATDKMRLLRDQPTSIVGDADWAKEIKRISEEYGIPEEQVKQDILAERPEAKQWIS